MILGIPRGVAPRRLALAALVLAGALGGPWAGPAGAVSDPGEMLANPKLEARAEAIGSQLRCLVCQNESIEDSNADLARDLRAIVRQRVVAGDSDQQVMDWMAARYGTFVRLKPPLTLGTALLWATPVLGLLIGGFAAWQGRRRMGGSPPPLNAAEQARLRGADGRAMIWVYIAALAALAVAPLGLYAWGGGRLRSRQYAAIALHRAQLSELDRDLAEGRLLPEEHAAAQLEVQRRLLADAALTETVGRPAGAGSLIVTAALIPVAALVLYLRIGQPEFPPRDAAMDAHPTLTPAQAEQAAKDDALIAQLRARVAMMDPHNENTLAGYALLGNAELKRGHLPEAAAAFKQFLAQRFDPTLAVETAEILTETAGQITPEALSLFKHALAAAPADAPWRPMAQKRVAEAGG